MSELCNHDHPKVEGGTVSAFEVYAMDFTAAIGSSDLASARRAAANMKFYCNEAHEKMIEIIARFEKPTADQPTMPIAVA